MFVCELDENRLQAESILFTLTRLIQEHVTSYEQKNAEVRGQSTPLCISLALFPLSVALLETRTPHSSFVFVPRVSRSAVMYRGAQQALRL